MVGWLWLLIVLCVGDLLEAYSSLADGTLRTLANAPTHSLDVSDGALLAPLLIKRVSGTKENAQVRDWIANQFNLLGWHVVLDNFTDTTPMGPISFTNVIATKNPDAPNRLVLAAHFDSKYFAANDFIGATDSAVPCALLLDLANVLDKSLSYASSTTLQLVFFDGEEAFVHWTDTDSTYGARHLANKWDTTFVKQQDAHTIKSSTELSGIEVLVLLDLLGTPNAKIPNYFRSTSWLFDRLVTLEQRLRDLSLLETASTQEKFVLGSFFDPESPMTYQGHATSDDHLPFLHRGVPILHIIPTPFPAVWHLPSDNADCIDPATVRNWARVWRVFTAEYLELDLSP